MQDFSLMAATRAVESTMPFVLYRLLNLLGRALALLFGTLAGAGTFIAFAAFSKNPTAFANVGAIVGFAGTAWLLYKLKAEWLFAVEAGHLILMAEQTSSGTLPAGWAQVEHAKQAAAERFSKGSAFYTLKDTLGDALSSLPHHYCPPLGRWRNGRAGRLLGWCLGRLLSADALAIIAAHCADTATANPWLYARGGLLFAARHCARLLRHRLQCGLLEALGFGAAFALLLYPIDWAVSGLPVDIGLWRYVFAAVFAQALRATFFQPIATAAMLRIYRQGIGAEPPAGHAEWAALSEQGEAVRRLLAAAEHA